MSDDYCGTRADPAPTEEGPPFAECVLCRKPTEYPESQKGNPVPRLRMAGGTAHRLFRLTGRGPKSPPTPSEDVPAASDEPIFRLADWRA